MITEQEKATGNMAVNAMIITITMKKNIIIRILSGGDGQCHRGPKATKRVSGALLAEW